MTTLQTQLGFLLYTDPGMGAMIWQLAAATLVGAGFYFRQNLKKLKNALRSKKREHSHS
jgi:hypothetical protein